MGERIMIALDTNMLLNIARFRVDVFAEARKMFGKPVFVVPKSVLLELEKVGEKGARYRREVRVAREAMRLNSVRVVLTEANEADASLESLAGKAIIATNDKELKDSVRELNGRVLFLKQRKLLEIA